MSSGGLSYSGLTNYGRTNLPSVESWGTNMNILRDPPKSIMTTKKNKVGQTSSITEMIDLSGDRVAETILVYPRGVNPMVSVSYSNDNSSQLSGNLVGLSESFNTISTSNTQSMLPYRIMNGQSFRPPVRKQEELLPLSRQPRVWTSQNTNLESVDFSKRVKEQGDSNTTKEVKTDVLKTFIRPTEYKRIEKPIEQPYETKYSIQKTMNIFANSGMRTRDITNQYVTDVNNGVNKNPLNINNVFSNVGQNIHKNNDTNLHTNNYIQDITQKEAFSNISAIGEYNNNNVNTNKYIQDINQIEALSNISAIGEYNNNTFNTTNYIQDINKIEACSNISGIGEYNNNNNVNTTNYIQDINQIEAFSNISGIGEYNNNNNVNTQKYIQDINKKDEVFSNISGIGENNNSMLNTKKYIQDVNIIDCTAPYSKVGDGTKYIHKDIELDRILPNHETLTNYSDSTKYIRIEPINVIHLDKNIPNAQFENNSVKKTNDVDDRTYILAPKINPGSYVDNNISKPLTGRIQQIPILQENYKTKISKYITNNFSR
jgi:hypothetical protein